MRNLFAPFIPGPGYKVTTVLVLHSVLVFIAMGALVSSFTWLNYAVMPLAISLGWGGAEQSLVLGGQWWRLVLALFVNGGIFPLAMNMIGLVILGIILEPRLGRWTYLGCFLGLGVLSMLLPLVLAEAQGEGGIFLIGSSGAVIGLLGMFFAMLSRGKIGTVHPGLLTALTLYIGFYAMLMVLFGGYQVVNTGGLLSGLVLGLALSFRIGGKSL